MWYCQFRAQGCTQPLHKKLRPTELHGEKLCVLAQQRVMCTLGRERGAGGLVFGSHWIGAIEAPVSRDHSCQRRVTSQDRATTRQPHASGARHQPILSPRSPLQSPQPRAAPETKGRNADGPKNSSKSGHDGMEAQHASWAWRHGSPPMGTSVGQPLLKRVGSLSYTAQRVHARCVLGRQETCTHTHSFQRWKLPCVPLLITRPQLMFPTRRDMWARCPADCPRTQCPVRRRRRLQKPSMDPEAEAEVGCWLPGRGRWSGVTA